MGEDLIGQRLGIYQVQARIGAGGMGVVYRAVDTNLSRPVAVKVLSNAIADPAARQRFQREAQTASSLNHPHIVTVLDAGEFEGRQYLVTEFIDGGTLRDWLQGAPRGWRQVVELLTGLADALATAHHAGILHRDVKPENILLTTSGYAKLADFGLAKLQEEPAAADDTATRTDLRTRQGVIVGTAAYMSPEQALGQPLDARSDIFSFGVVLYEALTGRRPFTGASDLNIVRAVVHSNAEPLSDDVPVPLRIVIEKALEKDPADRYQSMRDLVVDLRRVGRQPTAERTPSRSRSWMTAAGAVVLALLVAGAWLWSRFRQPAEPPRREYTQLTNFADSVVSPALSPDGRMLTFLRSDSAWGGKPGEVYVKLLPDGEPVQLTRDSRIKAHPKFSPDGTRIAYTTVIDDKLDTWVVPVLGGQPRLLLTNASGLTWAPDRRAPPGRPPLVLFSEMTGRGFQMAIASSTESRADRRTVYLPPGEPDMAHLSYLSPDGQQVLVVEMDSKGWLPCRLVPHDASSAGRPVGPAPAQCTDAAWSPDGRWMYFSTNTGNGTHIWRQRFPDGMPEQVIFGVTEEEGIGFAPDGRSFVTSIGNRQSTVWVHDSHGDRQITSEGFAFLPTVSPDGKKVYYLVRAGGSRNFLTGGLWVTDLESGQRQRILPDFQIQHYSISVDGQRVVFVAAEDGSGQLPLWLAPVNGSTPPRQLTSATGWGGAVSGAGVMVFASQEKSGASYLYRMNEDGTGIQKISPTPMLLPFGISPDGRWVPAAEGPSPETRNRLMLYPTDGGSPVRVCDCYPPPDVDNGPMAPQMSWTPDGKYMYLKFGAALYAIPLAPGHMLPPIPTAGFPSKEAVAALPGAQLIPQEGAFPGPHPGIYAFMKVSAQRNIYRVPVQ